MKRWWVFVSERFPLGSHVPMLASFTLANVFIGLALYSPVGPPVFDRGIGTPGPEVISWVRIGLAFVLAMSFFLRLRLFDEIKDLATDLLVNPTRPLARGLITVPEVKRALLILSAFELLLLLFLAPLIAASHLLAMIYSFVMYKEFFIGDRLRPHLTSYAVLHTFVSVLVGGSLVSVVTERPFWDFAPSLVTLLVINWGFFNLFEFARKTFAPSEERENVESYSKVFGIPGAVALSLSQAVLPLVLISNVLGPSITKSDWLLLGALLVLPLGAGLGFAIRKHTFGAKLFRGFVGVYLILGYLGLAWVLH
jgi:4-hydroxybenzoate polyprenyltransferase